MFEIPTISIFGITILKFLLKNRYVNVIDVNCTEAPMFTTLIWLTV